MLSKEVSSTIFWIFGLTTWDWTSVSRAFDIIGPYGIILRFYFSLEDFFFFIATSRSFRQFVYRQIMQWRIIEMANWKYYMVTIEKTAGIVSNLRPVNQTKQKWVNNKLSIDEPVQYLGGWLLKQQQIQ